MLWQEVICHFNSSLLPRPPSNTSRGKGSLVSIVQQILYLRNFGGTIRCGKYLTSTGLPYRCKPLSFTHHTFTDLLSTPSNLLKPSKTLQLAHSVRMLLYSPDPTSLFGGGSGNETISTLDQ